MSLTRPRLTTEYKKPARWLLYLVGGAHLREKNGHRRLRMAPDSVNGRDNRTEAVFARYNITDDRDMQDAIALQDAFRDRQSAEHNVVEMAVR